MRTRALVALTRMGPSAMSWHGSCCGAGCCLQSGYQGVSRVRSGVMDRWRCDDCFLEIRHRRIVCKILT